MNEELISLKFDKGIAEVYLMRAAKMNALDFPMMQAILDTGEKLKNLKGLRAVVISGIGKVFSAGLDMGIFGQLTDTNSFFDRKYGLTNLLQQISLVWREIPVPVIAAMHGIAYGAGFQIALGADMRYVTPDIKMAILEIKWGLIPDMGGNVLMRHLARSDVIRELTYTGRVFSGTEALAYGFATRVCIDPLAEALGTAKEIASKNPEAIRAGKRLMIIAEQASVAEILIAETQEQLGLIAKPNQIEAVMANLEKREPTFSD
jgi:enoyl-CoA hydratase/carnithine racemase